MRIAAWTACTLIALVALDETGRGSRAIAGGSVVEPDAARRTELIRLVRHDCGSCHGMRLSGGLGPSLLPEALADKPEDGLVATILGGRPGTPMPGWAGLLNEDETRWILRRLNQGFPSLR